MTKLFSTITLIAEGILVTCSNIILGLMAIPALLFIYVALPLAMLAVPFMILSAIF